MTRRALRAGPAGRGAVRARRRATPVWGAVIFAALAGGCGAPARPDATAAPTIATSSSTSSAPPVTDPTAVVSPESVRIGFLAAAGSGPGSALSQAVGNGERLAVSQFTSDHPMITVSVDTAPAAETVAATRRLIADGVVAVIGPQLSSEARLALPVLTAAGVPAVTATATATDLDSAGWTSFFRVVADDRQQGIGAATELVGSLHVATLAVLAGDAGGAQTRASWVSSSATGLGAVVTDESTVSTSVEAAAAARLVVGSGVGGVYFSGAPSVARSLVTDLAGDGYQGVVMIASDLAASALGPLGAGADGAYVVSSADDPAAIGAHGGNGLVFDDAYRAAFGTDPPVWAAEGYDATNDVLAAVASGASTGPAVGAYLFNHTWSGVTGQLSFNSNGNQVDPPVFVSRVVGGATVRIAVAVPPGS